MYESESQAKDGQLWPIEDTCFRCFATALSQRGGSLSNVFDREEETTTYWNFIENGLVGLLLFKVHCFLWSAFDWSWLVVFRLTLTRVRIFHRMFFVFVLACQACEIVSSSCLTCVSMTHGNQCDRVRNKQMTCAASFCIVWGGKQWTPGNRHSQIPTLKV